MKNIILALLLLSTASVYGKSSSIDGMVEIRPGVSLYVEHYPAAPGKPTVFLANGLTYSTRQYTPIIKALRDLEPGLGVVAWDMQGMGKTLLENLDVRKASIPLEGQARDLHDLVKALRIPGPISLMGLSYGGSLALLYATLFPDEFDNFITFAPMVERLAEQDTLLNGWVTAHKLMYPLDPRNEDELYDHYLRIWIYSTYPAAEPIILENPWKLEAVFRMVQGVKNFNAFKKAAHFPVGKMHLIAAVNDEHVKIRRLDEFWNKIPEQSRASFLRLHSSKHKIPEQWPKEAAAWVWQILTKNLHLQRGLTFEGDPFEAVAEHGPIRVALERSALIAMYFNQAGDCESLLRTVPKPVEN